MNSLSGQVFLISFRRRGRVMVCTLDSGSSGLVRTLVVGQEA